MVSSSAVDLARGEADIAIRLFRETRGDLVARKIGEIGWSLYAAPSYLARKPRPSDPCALRGHDVIGFADSTARAPGSRWLEAHSEGSSVVFRGTSMTAVVNAAKAGMGIAVVPCFMADAALERLTTQVLAKSDAFLVTTLEGKSSARVRIVGDALANLFVKERALLAG